jgi:large subunit ribosomal protein L9
VQVTIPKRVGETGTLYGSVTAGDVAEALEAKGFTVDRRRIDLEGGIKTLGDHPVRVELHSEVTAEITVSVVPEE